MNSLPQKATGPYHEPVLLDTLFLRGPDGTTYEIPLTEALRFRVTPERVRELGHAPFPPAEDEVVGHHKIPSSSPADPTGWTFHTTWEFGAYYDQNAGRFAVGMHRHPYGDDRAVAGLEGDFA